MAALPMFVFFVVTGCAHENVLDYLLLRPYSSVD